MARFKEEIAATIKSTVATASRIALWPLIVLNKNIKRANRRIVRWAIRNRSRPAYVFALFWFPASMLAMLIWAMASLPYKADPDATLLFAAFMAKKIALIVLFIAEEAIPTIRAIRHYRRQFPRNA